MGLHTPIPSTSRSPRHDRLTPAEGARVHDASLAAGGRVGVDPEPAARAIADVLAQATAMPRTVPDS